MSNGDISLTDIAQEEFFQMTPEDREWLSFRVSQNLSKTCKGRPSHCDARYVKRSSVKVIFFVMVAFLLGLGIIQVSVIIPFVVKGAIAAALAAL